MMDNETIDELDARLKREWEERQEIERAGRVRSSSFAEYELLKTTMLSGAKTALMRRPVTEYPDVRGMSDAEYQAQRSRFVRGGR
ncbi:hypothetical protein WJ60_14385 [Burkholderia ubonensis]|uniref:hypothetical protein n=1 Tax=Burkholderia ubonensis TaxID=101571 RepID=UPI00075EE16B|nr:hypothetical protein [Burkholderia ubonensis]KVM66531.1 hypothetical protein WJ60_14385 [Burkholderia ubonensis]KVX76278.1 hypothetical protein WL08_16640 [Burkholderia ubonensis]